MTIPNAREGQPTGEIPISDSAGSVTKRIGLLRSEERALSEEAARRIRGRYLPRLPGLAHG